MRCVIEEISDDDDWGNSKPSRILKKAKPPSTSPTTTTTTMTAKNEEEEEEEAEIKINGRSLLKILHLLVGISSLEELFSPRIRRLRKSDTGECGVQLWHSVA
ncbi:uncharacterized protein A4U43_C01F6100 [Asparagus officinalis]|uniref:Uncharacterized protein n=1 Tax=Asparagus officinalis TaxID=4686 RepID=A0A5P1FNW4_ASPOF|nr:uncharacterized protein A4U43_C01F6100 [Asparagus officinalis]